MVVVVIIAILAAVVVPSWVRSARKAKADTEIAAMFAEIATKEEQYKTEVGSYLATAQCPTTTSTAGVDFNYTCNAATGWANLRVIPTDSAIRCKYQVFADVANTALTPGSTFTVPCTTSPTCTTVTPPTAWYYIMAICDMDGQGDGSTNTTFFQSSLDTKYQKDGNYGQ